MKAKELKDILDRLPDEATIKIMDKNDGRGYRERKATRIEVDMEIKPSPGDDFNKTKGKIYIYIE